MNVDHNIQINKRRLSQQNSLQDTFLHRHHNKEYYCPEPISLSSCSSSLNVVSHQQDNKHKQSELGLSTYFETEYNRNPSETEGENHIIHEQSNNKLGDHFSRFLSYANKKFGDLKRSRTGKDYYSEKNREEQNSSDFRKSGLLVSEDENQDQKVNLNESNNQTTKFVQSFSNRVPLKQSNQENSNYTSDEYTALGTETKSFRGQVSKVSKVSKVSSTLFRTLPPLFSREESNQFGNKSFEQELITIENRDNQAHNMISSTQESSSRSFDNHSSLLDEDVGNDNENCIVLNIEEWNLWVIGYRERQYRQVEKMKMERRERIRERYIKGVRVERHIQWNQVVNSLFCCFSAENLIEMTSKDQNVLDSSPPIVNI